MGREDHDKRIAVGRAGGGRGSADDAVGAGAVLDDDRLGEELGERLGDQAGGDVGGAAGGIGDDNAQRPGRIVGGVGAAGQAEAGGERHEGATRQREVVHLRFPGWHFADA